MIFRHYTNRLAAKSPVYHEARRIKLAQHPETIPSWIAAVHAADSKKAVNIRVLDLRDVTSFTDYFIVCTGTNSRHVQAIADEVQKQLHEHGERPTAIEGFQNAEWVLADYGSFIVHIFSDEARKFYDLERLWRDAKEVKLPAA